MYSSEDPEDGTGSSKPRGRNFNITVVCLCVSIFIATVDTIIVAAALSSIATALDATTTQAFWCGTILLFTQCVSQPIYGALAEALGRKTTAILGLALFSAGSLLGALAKDIHVLIAARAIMGLGTGGINVSVNVIIVDLVPQRERAKLSGLTSLAGALGLVAGVLCGAVLAQTSWRWIFWINLPISIPTLVCILLFMRVKEEKISITKRVRTMDWSGMVLLTGSLVGVIYGVMSGGSVYAWSSTQIISAITLGASGIIAFGVYENTLAGRCGLAPPFIPLRLLGNRTAAAGYLVTLVHAMVLWALCYYMLLYFHLCASKTPLESGVTFLPSTLLVPIFAATGGLAMSRLSHFKYFNVASMLLITTGVAGMTTLPADPSLGQQIGFQILYSIGGGALFPGRLVAVQASQLEDDTRMATSLVSFTTSLGQAFGVAIGGTVIQNVWNRDVAAAVADRSLPQQYVLDGSRAAQAAEIIAGFPEEIAGFYRQVGAGSIGRVWLVCAVLGGVGVVASLLSGNLSLDKTEDSSPEVEPSEKEPGALQL